MLDAATHFSALSKNPFTAPTTSGYTMAMLIADFMSNQLVCPPPASNKSHCAPGASLRPGEAFSYSNFAYGLLCPEAPTADPVVNEVIQPRHDKDAAGDTAIGLSWDISVAHDPTAKQPHPTFTIVSKGGDDIAPCTRTSLSPSI